MIGAIVAKQIHMGLVLGVLVVGAAGACGGSAASSGAPVASPASAAPAGPETGSQMTIQVNADKSINKGRPLHVVVRAVDLNTYLQDSYAEVAAKVVTPDDSVIGQGIVYPGHDSTLKVPRPDKGAVAVYFLFTQPGSGWKTFIEQPLPAATALALGNNGISGSKHMLAEAGNPAGKSKGKGKKHGGRKVALAGGGVGAAGLVAGTVFGLLARSRWNQTSAYCNANNECTSQTGVTLGNQANTYGQIANISFGIGVAGIATGATLWLMTPSSADKAKSTQKKSALIAGGAGAAGLVAGTVFGLLARSRWNQTSTYCSANGLCTSQTGIDLGNQARIYGWISNISFTIGVVGLATGATLWFTAPSPAGKGAQSATIAPLVGSDYAGASVLMRF